MKKIYIARHGESEGNSGNFISFPHTPLTNKGHKEAQKLGERLTKEKIKFDRIYCSPLYRSLQTLEDLLKAGIRIKQENIEINDLLREINRKEFEGKPRELYYAQKEKSKSPENYRCRGGESENDVKKRAERFLSLIKRRNDKIVLIITHGHFLRHFMAFLGFPSGLSHPHGCSLSLVEINSEKGKPKLIFWNDISHLS